MPSSSGFASFWASRDVAALGNAILLVGLLAWGYHAEESATVVSILVVATLLPPFLLKPLADRLVFGRRAYPVALVAQLAIIAALFPLLGATTPADLWLVLVMVFVAAIPSAFLKATRRAMLPALAGEGLAAAEKALSNTRLVSMVAGPAVGTLLYSSASQGTTGFSTCVMGAIVALTLSTALLLLARPPQPAPAVAETRSLGSALAGLQKGLRHVWRHPALRTVATVQLTAALLTGGLAILQVALMIWGVHTSAENVGTVLAAQGAGMAVAAFGRGFLKKHFLASTRVATGLGLIASGGFGFAIAQSLNGAVACGLAIGLGLGMLGPALTSLVGSLSAEEWARPVSEGLAFAVGAAVILSATFLGRLTDTLGPRYAIVLLAVLLAVLALYSFGAVPDPEAADPEKEAAHLTPDMLYDVGSGIPTGTTLG